MMILTASSPFFRNEFRRNLNDVTLARKDGQQKKAHRIILSASSPFFRSEFRKNLRS